LALEAGVNILNPLHAWPNKPSYELRLAKYAYRGFPVLVPGLDKKRIDYDRIRQTDLCELKGLARLLKIAFEMDGSLDERADDFPQEPREVQKLKSHVKREYDETELLTRGLTSGYMEDVDSILIPSVYGEGQPNNMMWYDYVGGDSHDFPLAADCREDAWEGTVHAQGRAPEGVPEELKDAWEMEKRSREYLNSEMDAYDLDNIYYGHAYVYDA
jgi:hypothetical protein